ncbi:MAG: hypothetical protein Q9163_002967 [Psora crenata]
MPFRGTHPLALFSLKPLNPRSLEAVKHSQNSHLVSKLPGDGEAPGLDVVYDIRSQSPNTLATLGRSDTDIILEGSIIGRVQCSFEINPDTKVVMLYDRLNAQTNQVSGANATPFEHGRPRRVVVQRDLNTIVGMGGVAQNLFQFELIWHKDPIEMFVNQQDIPWGQEGNPRLARTEDEQPTVLPLQRVTRVHASGQLNPVIRYREIGLPVGSGQFATVHKCINTDSGDFMAVKILKRPPGKSQEVWRAELHCTVKNEVETLSRINHPHIVEYITSEGWGGEEVKIYMGLNEGTLGPLVQSIGGDPASVATSVFPQMLSALDCLAHNGIVHRDEAVLEAARNDPTVSNIQEMAEPDPSQRASAAQMLVKWFNGNGLSTPPNQVPALDHQGPAPTNPVSTAQDFMN